MKDSKLTHIDEEGRARMVDVGQKSVTRRSATASGRVKMSQEALRLVREGSSKGTRREHSVAEKIETGA